MFPCTSHGDAALLELPRGGRRPAFLCYSTALLASLSLSFHTLLIYFYPCGCGCTGMPTPNTSARRNKWQSRRTKVIYHRAERAARRTASSTPTHAHAPSHSLYVNKVPLDSLCSPSCFHPICPQSVASSPGPNTNTRWHDQEQ